MALLMKYMYFKVLLIGQHSGCSHFTQAIATLSWIDWHFVHADICVNGFVCLFISRRYSSQWWLHPYLLCNHAGIVQWQADRWRRQQQVERGAKDHVCWWLCRNGGLEHVDWTRHSEVAHSDRWDAVPYLCIHVLDVRHGCLCFFLLKSVK